MQSAPKKQPLQIHLELRWKLAILFGAPILFMLVGLSLASYSQINRALQEQMEVTATQMGEVILAGLNHGMLTNDSAMIAEVLMHIDQQTSVRRVWILDVEGQVRSSSRPAEVGQQWTKADLGCVECHQESASRQTGLPRVMHVRQAEDTLRIITPINNAPECTTCHAPSLPHLGVLLVDSSLADAQKTILYGQQWNLLLTIVVILLAVLGVFELVQLLVTRRIEMIQKAMAAFRQGDYSVRIHHPWRSTDEITRLAVDFNRMAEALEHHERQQAERTQVRQQAVLEERERIARELHDGVAQFLGYINTKIMAAQLLLQNQQVEQVEHNLAQIGEAVHDQSLDVRASIIGLKMDSQSGMGLVPALQRYVELCRRLTDFTLALHTDPAVEPLRLPPETELQLMRVVQEAISNVRKHAQARHVQIQVSKQAHELVIVVADDGQGFHPWAMPADQRQHFGLQIMHERAEMVGARLLIVSEPGCGTTVSLRLNLEEAPCV